MSCATAIPITHANTSWDTNAASANTHHWNNNHRPERVGPALHSSLEKLGLDYVDLYLMHTPFAFQPGDDQDPRDAEGRVVYDDGVTLEQTWQRWRPSSTPA